MAPSPTKDLQCGLKEMSSSWEKKEQCVVFFLSKLTKKEMIKNQVNNADN